MGKWRQVPASFPENGNEGNAAMIRRLFVALGCAWALAALLAPISGARADMQDFSVVNQGGKDVWYVQVKANYESAWPADVLGDNVLIPGNQADIVMSGYSSHCFFDIRVEDSGGYVETYADVDLCKASYVYFPADAPQTKAGGELITVVNNGATAVWYIHIKPNYSDPWEEDVLGDEVLMPGMQIPVTLNGYNGHCFFDVKVEDSKGYAREYYDVNVCKSDFVYFP